MDIHTTDTQEEILGALRQIQDSAGIQREAQSNPEGLLTRLKLSGIARHAVALAIAGIVAAGPVSGSLATPTNFWG